VGSGSGSGPISSTPFSDGSARARDGRLSRGPANDLLKGVLASSGATAYFDQIDWVAVVAGVIVAG
jgi:hypothetical protein